MIETILTDMSSMQGGRLLIPRGNIKPFTFYFNNFHPFLNQYFMKNLSSQFLYMNFDNNAPSFDHYYIDEANDLKCEEYYLEDELFELIEGRHDEEYDEIIEDFIFYITGDSKLIKLFHHNTTNDFNYKNIEILKRKILGEI